jgi:hypothetical protein
MGFGPLNHYEFIYLFHAVFLPGRFCPLKHLCLRSLIGMYGPPQCCKRKTIDDNLVGANVFGL